MTGTVYRRTLLMLPIQYKIWLGLSATRTRFCKLADTDKKMMVFFS